LLRLSFRMLNRPDEPSPEPFVIVERPVTAPARRWTVLHGRKPAILLVDRDGAGLDHPLAEGFDVYRTTGRDSALEVLRSHPGVLMSLVRAGLPGLDAPSLIRELQEARPGLWVGLVCDPGDRAGAAAAYAAGAVDLFHPGANPVDTVERLIRGVPWALRRREAAERRIERRLERRPSPPWRRWARRSALPLGILVCLGLGAVLAAATQVWHESRDLWNARMERILTALEAPGTERPERPFERWHRTEQINLQRESQRELQQFRREQLEEGRVQEILRYLPRPQYSVR
jgi:hypothetical protein